MYSEKNTLIFEGIFHHSLQQSLALPDLLRGICKLNMNHRRDIISRETMHLHMTSEVPCMLADSAGNAGDGLVQFSTKLTSKECQMLFRQVLNGEIAFSMGKANTQQQAPINFSIC